MRITVRVQPKARISSVEMGAADVLRVRVTVPAEDGKANEAVVEVLAKALGVAKSHVEILVGHKARTKIVNVPLEMAQIRERLLPG